VAGSFTTPKILHGDLHVTKEPYKRDINMYIYIWTMCGWFVHDTEKNYKRDLHISKECYKSDLHIYKYISMICG